MDLDEYRRTSAGTWEHVSASWERRGALIRAAAAPVTEWLVDALDPAPGDVVLELAAGAGDTGYAAAERLGDSGRLISSDFAPAMLDAARRRAEELGLESVDHRLLDAEAIDLPDDSVDGVLCRWGYMLVADRDRAMRETRRVLRAGGRLALAVWAEPEVNPWASLFGRVLAERGHTSPPEPGAPGMFALGDEEALSELLAGADLEVARVERVSVTWPFVDAQTYWTVTSELAGASAQLLETLPADERSAIRDEVIKRLEPLRSDDGGYELEGVCICALAE